MSAVLVLDSLVKNFGSLRVTDHVSLELRHDECVGLIGPNGAGKSTLINLVAGNLALESGKVVLEGTDISHHSMPQRARAGLGRTFQGAALLEERIGEVPARRMWQRRARSHGSRENPLA